MMFALKKMQTTGSRAGSSAELFFKTSFSPLSLRKKAQEEKNTTSGLQKVRFKHKAEPICFFFPFFFFLKTWTGNRKSAGSVSTACFKEQCNKRGSQLQLGDFKQLLYNTPVLLYYIVSASADSSLKLLCRNGITNQSCPHAVLPIVNRAPQQLRKFNCCYLLTKAFNRHYQSGTCPVASPVTMRRHHISILKGPHRESPSSTTGSCHSSKVQALRVKRKRP